MQGRTIVSRHGRHWVIAGVLVGLTAVYLWLFGFATFFAVEASYMAWRAPVVRRTPVELNDQSVAQTTGRNLSYFGYEFEVP